MKNNEKAIEYLEKHIPELAEAAVKQAYWQSLAAGNRVLISDNGVLTEVFPDGTTKIIEKNKPFVKVQKGQIIKLK
jgi:hypothetical protein